MSDIVTERFGSIVRVQLNRPAKKNAVRVLCLSNMKAERSQYRKLSFQIA